MRLVVAVVLCLLNACCASVPNVYQQAKPATVRLEFDDGVCSGVATGPHSIITAAHCVETRDATFTVTVEGQKSSAVVVANDGNDHVVLRVTVRQQHIAAIHAAALSPGDSLFVWGNPDGLANVLRLVRVAGTDTKSNLCLSTLKRRVCSLVYVDGSLWHGDSGAAIFAANGDLIGIDSGSYSNSLIHPDPSGLQPPQIEVWTLPFFYPLTFSPAQLALARQ